MILIIVLLLALCYCLHSTYFFSRSLARSCLVLSHSAGLALVASGCWLSSQAKSVVLWLQSPFRPESLPSPCQRHQGLRLGHCAYKGCVPAPPRASLLQFRFQLFCSSDLLLYLKWLQRLNFIVSHSPCSQHYRQKPLLFLEQEYC